MTFTMITMKVAMGEIGLLTSGAVHLTGPALPEMCSTHSPQDHVPFQSLQSNHTAHCQLT